MTWLEAAKEAGKEWGLDRDIEESSDMHLSDGCSAEEAAYNAAYDWDVSIDPDVAEKVNEKEI